MLFRGNFSFVVALTEESVILYDGLEIRPLSFGTGWVLIGYSLGWSPGKAPEIPADVGGEWEEPGRGWGGGLLGVKFLYKKDVGKICYKEIKSYLCVVRLNVRLNVPLSPLFLRKIVTATYKPISIHYGIP